jgi:hypothetical protein
MNLLQFECEADLAERDSEVICAKRATMLFVVVIMRQLHESDGDEIASGGEISRICENGS